MALVGQIVAAKLALRENSMASSVTTKIATGSDKCPARERFDIGAEGASERALSVSDTRSRSGPVGGRPCTAAAKMLESPVLSGMSRSAAAVALAGNPKNQMSESGHPPARTISRRRRQAIAIIAAAARN